MVVYHMAIDNPNIQVVTSAVREIKQRKGTKGNRTDCTSLRMSL